VAGGGRKNADAALALALAGGATVEGAARSAGVSPRTAYRRLDDPAFRGRVDEIRADMVRLATGRLAALGTEMIETLRALLGSKDDRIRLAAVRAGLAEMRKTSGLFEFERRLLEDGAPLPPRPEEVP
jgi:hypothetical protein